jgi:hypothetical protein
MKRIMPVKGHLKDLNKGQNRFMAEKLLLNDQYKTNEKPSKNTNSENLESDNDNNSPEDSSNSKNQNQDFKFKLFEENQSKFIPLAKYLKYEAEFIEKEVKPLEEEGEFKMASKLDVNLKTKTLRSQTSKNGLFSSRSINAEDSYTGSRNNINFAGKHKQLDKMRSYIKEHLDLDIENNEDFHKYQKEQQKNENKFKKKSKFGIHIGKIFQSREKIKYILKLKFIFKSPKYIMFRYYLNRSSKYFFFINNLYKILNVCTFLLVTNSFIINLVSLIAQSMYLLWIFLVCPFEQWFHNLFVLTSESILFFFIGKITNFCNFKF